MKHLERHELLVMDELSLVMTSKEPRFKQVKHFGNKELVPRP